MKETDRLKREMVDLKNEADTTIHTTEKSINEHRDKVPADVVEECQTEINNLRNMLNESNTEAEPLREQVEKVK